MSKTAIVLLVICTLIAALVGAALPVLLVGKNSTVVSGGTSAPVRHIDVTGSGKVYAAPDQATVQLGVTSQATSAAEALKDNSAKTAVVLTSIKKIGVDAKDIQTHDFSIYPTYASNGTTITGYQVNNTVVVVIRDLANAGTILDQVVQAGANNISGLSFDIADPSKLQAEARAKAIADARAKAEAMASAAGVSLGDIMTISESVSSPPMPMGRMAMADAAAVPVATGQQQIAVDVTISFVLR
ncbi:MAG: DUF541 domain-containing protein [Chloroflexia bacterium]|nr:DUF541 domain-containing protein [Chloroflexia bacterium]